MSRKTVNLPRGIKESRGMRGFFSFVRHEKERFEFLYAKRVFGSQFARKSMDLTTAFARSITYLCRTRKFQRIKKTSSTLAQGKGAYQVVCEGNTCQASTTRLEIGENNLATQTNSASSKTSELLPDWLYC